MPRRMSKGSQKAVSASGNRNDAGITPTMVSTPSLKRSGRPTMPASPPKRVCQVAWLMIPTGLVPSSGAKALPGSGAMPRNGSRPGDTRAPCIVFRLAAAGEDALDAVVRLDALEQRPLVAPVLDHRDRLPGTAPVRSPPVQLHQPMRLGERHRVQQQAVDDGENRGGHGHAEPQDEDHGDGEPRRPAQDAHAVAEVLQQRVEPVQAVGLMVRLLDRRNHPEVAVRHAGRFPFAHSPC